MSRTKTTLFFIGRALLSLIFLVEGVKKILYWQAMEESVIMTLCDWHMYLHGSYFIDTLMGYAPILLAIATFLEIAGGLILLFGYFFRVGAVFLLIFLIPTTLLYHPFWFHIGDKYSLELAMFLKNLAIIGSLLLLSLGPRFKKQQES